MKAVVHKIKTKFDAEQRVYYRTGQKVRKTTINRVEVRTVIKRGKAPETGVYYMAQGTRRDFGYWRELLAFSENELYSETDYIKILLPKIEQEKIEDKIKLIKKRIINNKKSVKNAQEKLDEIRKEELIEQLAGLK